MNRHLAAIFSIIFLIGLLPACFYPNAIRSLSPSFPHQSVSDPANDWDLQQRTWNNITGASSISECKFDGVSASDISGVSYTSDGSFLNATIWLSGPFQDPATDFLNHVYLRVYPRVNTTLDEQLQRQIESLNYTYKEFKIIKLDTNRTLGGNPGYSLEYSYLDDSSGKLLQNLQVGASSGHILYIINYTADAQEYELAIDDVSKMIDSLTLGQNHTYIQAFNNTTDFVTYQNSTHGIELQYPQKWFAIRPAQEFNGDFEDILLLFIKPIWIEKVYKVHIDVFSIFDTGIDYSVRFEWSQDSMSWTKLVTEESPTGEERIIEKVENYTLFFDNANNYINMLLDMSSLNFPDSYKLVFTAQDVFNLGGNLCYLMDVSNPVTAPPPQFNTTVYPNPLLLRPGEQKDIEVKITSDTNLDGTIFLATEGQVNNTELAFVPRNISVLPFGTTVSTLKVKALENASSGSYLIPVFERIEVGSPLENKQTQFRFNVTERPEINKRYYLTVTVLPPLALQEHLSGFVNSWISPISGLASFLAGVAAGISPLAVRFYSRRQAAKENKQAKDSQQE